MRAKLKLKIVEVNGLLYAEGSGVLLPSANSKDAALMWVAVFKDRRVSEVRKSSKAIGE